VRGYHALHALPGMRLTIVCTAAALLAVPARARADLLITPHAGVNFGGSTVDRRANIGGSLTWLGASGLGIEVDVGFIPDFFEAKDLELDILGTNNVTTVMGNVVFARSVGGMQPYLVGGAGLIRSQLGSFGEFFDATDNGVGVNAGAGIRFGSGRLSLRGDVRYFRTVTDVERRVLEDALGDFSFWRAAAGVSIGF
jgi:hypothetical protein